MMKTVLANILLSGLLVCIFTGVAGAASVYDMEEEAETGSMWRMDAPGAEYVFAGGAQATLVEQNGETWVRLDNPGDVKMQVYVPGYDRPYKVIIHVYGERMVEAGGRIYNESYAAQGDARAYAQRVLELCNQERVSRGLPQLVLMEDLMQVAACRAEEITRYFSHTRPNGSGWDTLLRNKKHTWGENIAGGQSTPEEVVEGWMNSPGHRANILNGSFRELGVGYFYQADGEYLHYWVQNFRG